MKKYLLALILSLFLPTLANAATVSAVGIKLTPTGIKTSLANANALNSAPRNISYTYDALNRLKTVTDWNNKTTTYQYHPNSYNRSIVTHPNGLQTAYTYDALDRLTKIEVKRLSDYVTIQIIDYGTINPHGQKAQQQISYPTLTASEASYANSNVSYQYDNLNRLKQSLEIGASSINTSAIYNYDEVGNLNTGIISANGIFTNTNGTLGPINTQYDKLDRVGEATINGIRETYRYDLAGNLIHKGNNQQHNFDILNRLTDTRTFTPPTAAGSYTGTTARISYTYDADGHRISRAKTSVGTIAIIAAPPTPVAHDITHYALDKTSAYAQTTEERDGNGTLIAAYVLTPYGERISEERNMAHSQNGGNNTGFNLQSYTYHSDHLGSTKMVTDSNGAIVSTWRYTDYGQVIYKTGTHPTNYLFTGEHQDADNGLIYLRTRYYAPSMARFVSQDSFEGNPAMPVTLNKYVYGNGDPVNMRDPSGKAGVFGTFATNAYAIGLNLAYNSAYAIAALGGARLVSLAVGSVTFMATKGQQLAQTLNATGARGLAALEASALQVARTGPVASGSIQKSWDVTSKYAETLNSTLGVNAQALGYQWHHLVERTAGTRAGYGAIVNTAANIVPVKDSIHTVISRAHASLTTLNIPLRTHISNLFNAGKITIEEWHFMEAQIYARAVQLNGANLSATDLAHIVPGL